MKTLLLLRHAKSGRGDPGRRDFDRTLDERGREAAPLVGRYMLEQGLVPDLVLSSTAERARQTAALVAGAARLVAPLSYDERIYEAPRERLVSVVSELDDSEACVLLVGHNPGMEELIAYLTGEARRVPTAALARVDLDVEHWREVREGAGRLAWLVAPPQGLPGE